MASSGESGSEDNGQSIRSLIASVKSDAEALLKAQKQLTQIELQQTVSGAAGTGGMFGGAAVFGALGGFFLLVTIAWGLIALGLPYWAGFGIVTVLLFIVAGILALIGKRKSDRIKGPELAKSEWELNKQALTGQVPEKLPAVRSADGLSKAGKPNQA